MLHHVIEIVLPSIISILEIMGILIVIWSAVHSFWEYIQNAFMHKHLHIQSDLAKGLATGLEFKLGAEILKTVLVQSLDELYVLGAVILLRSLMSLLIHFEMKHAAHDEAEADKVAEKSEEKTEEAETV
jgi:uncharacterized membrane protein